LTYNTAQGTTQEHAIRIGDALYIKEGTARWIKQQDLDQRDVFAALPAARFAQLQFVGPEAVNGTTQYHVKFVVTGFPFHSVEDILVNQAPSQSTWDAWVDATGAPIKAMMAASFYGVVEQRSIPINVVFEYDFSHVGDPVVIKPPAGV